MRVPHPGRAKDFFGLCQGLSAYTSIDVDWMQSLFVILSVFTAGLPGLIYLVLAFVLPVVRTKRTMPPAWNALDVHQGCRPTKPSPARSSKPRMRLRHCTALPAAPFIKLSIEHSKVTLRPSSLR